jgi:hypothetical protein
MALSLEELSARVERLDQEVQLIQRRIPGDGVVTQERSVERERLIRLFDQFLEATGAAGVEPIGAERLQEQMERSGIRAEDCVLSRGIIAMREE